MKKPPPKTAEYQQKSYWDVDHIEMLKPGDKHFIKGYARGRTVRSSTVKILQEELNLDETVEKEDPLRGHNGGPAIEGAEKTDRVREYKFSRLVLLTTARLLVTRMMVKPKRPFSEDRNKKVEYFLHFLMTPDNVDARMYDLEEMFGVYRHRFTTRRARRLIRWQKFLVVSGALVEFIKSKLPGVKLIRSLLPASGDDK